MKRSIAVLIAAAALAQSPARRSPGTIVIDASEFYTDMPAGDTTGGGFGPAAAAGPWLFNNSILNLGSKQDAIATVTIPEAGAYRLFVRSQGTPAASFRVSVEGQLAAETFGNGPLAWTPSTSFNLNPGSVQVRLTAINPRPTLNVLVLSKDPNFSEAALQSLELPQEVEVLKEYKIPAASIIKFGDVDGDGKPDFLVITPNYSAIMYNNAGAELWHWDAPQQDARLRGEFEAPGSIWDFDRDGRAEVIHWRIVDGKEWLVMADGLTGAIKHQVPWPTPPLPHVYNNFRTAIARLHPGYADSLLVFTDSGGVISVTAYDRELKQLWQHTERRKKDFFGHYVYPVDLNGDGIDEILVSHLCLDSKGNEIWNNYAIFDDNHDHMDTMEFFDLDGDGKPELITGQSDVGALAYRALTGELLWHNMADHTQQIAAGYILKGSTTPQVVANGRVYGTRETGGLSALLYWFDNKGNLLHKWPANPISGNPNFVRGDWYGDGTKQFFWHKFHLGEDGKGHLYFREPVYHMFDFLNNGAEQVITWDRTIMRVYGYRNVKPRPIKRDSEYIRNSIANHTHY